MNYSTSGLFAKVKVLDTGSGLCFETDIQPEEVNTNRYFRSCETTMSFSPVKVPDIEDWNAEWNERLFGARKWINVTIKKIIFSGPCTIVLWDDGTKTIARVSEGDEFDSEKGVAICFMKKILGHTETNKLLRKAHDQYDKEMWEVKR